MFSLNSKNTKNAKNFLDFKLSYGLEASNKSVLAPWELLIIAIFSSFEMIVVSSKFLADAAAEDIWFYCCYYFSCKLVKFSKYS